MNFKTLLVSSGVVLLLVGAFAGYLYGVNSTPKRTTTETTLVSSLNAYDQLASTYANQLLLLNSRNASAVASRYESNATIEWTGQAVALEGCELAGNFTGAKNITALLGAFQTHHEGDLVVSNETQTIGPSGSYWVIRSTFNIAGNSSLVGSFEAAIAVQDSYVHVADTWLITSETWNVVNITEQYPVSTMNIPCVGQ
jgi:hypothetical protein